MADPKSILDPLQVSTSVKGDAWDAFHAVSSPEDFKAKFDKIALPTEAKAALWDAKFSGQQPQEHSAAEFGSNVLSSGANLLGDLGHAVMHPIDTAGALVKTAVGTVDKVVGGTGTTESNALWDHLKQRYGSFDKTKETMYQDPVGFLGDLSTAFGGVGEVADAAKLGKVAKVAKVASEVTNPVTAPVKAVAAIPGVKAGVTAAADATQNALNRGALRGGFQTTTDAGKVANAAETMGERAIPFSQKGIDQVNQAIRKLQQQKEASVGRAAAGGVTIDPAAVEQRLDQVASQKEWQVNPNTDVKQVEQVRQNFRQRTGGQAIPADEAEALKEGTYANNQYDRTPVNAQATADAEKALARGLKEELETQIPELKGLNESQGKLLDLQGILTKAVNKYTNSGGFLNSMKKGLGSNASKVIAGLSGATAVASHNPTVAAVGGAADVMMAVLSDPAVKARLGRAIGAAQQSNPGKYAAMVTPAARISSYVNSLSPQQTSDTSVDDLSSRYKASGLKAGSLTPTDEEIQAAANQVMNARK